MTVCRRTAQTGIGWRSLKVRCCRRWEWSGEDGIPAEPAGRPLGWIFLREKARESAVEIVAVLGGAVINRIKTVPRKGDDAASGETEFPPAQRRMVRKALEHSREMRLGAKADTQSHFGYWRAARRQQRLRFLDTPLQKILMRTQTGGFAKLRGEMHATETSFTREVGKRNRIVSVAFDEIGNAPKAPSRKRRHIALCCRYSLFGAKRKQPCDYGEAQRVGVEHRVGTEFSARQQCNAQIEDQRVAGIVRIGEDNVTYRRLAI